MLLPDGFDWRAEWPVGAVLDLGDGLADVTEHWETGLVAHYREPYLFGEGRWRRTVRFEDVRVVSRP